MKRALVLVHEPDGYACRVAERLEQRGFAVDNHLITTDYDQPQNATPFPTLEGYDLLVPMGSVRSLTNKAEIDSWIYDELAIIEAAHNADVPILGVCFGGQLISDALGGSVEPAPVSEIGWFELQAPDGMHVPAGAGPWLVWHHDRFTPPPGAEVLATTENAVQLFRIGRTVGSQFHPEVDANHVAAWLAMSDDDYITTWGIDAEALMAETKRRETANVKQCHAFVDWFLDDVAFPV